MAALVLFHLEADLHRLQIEPDVVSNSGGPVAVLRRPVAGLYFLHSLIQQHIIPAATSAGDQDLLGFCRDWFVVRATLWQNWSVVDDLQRYCGDDAWAQLLRGVLYAQSMGPITHGDGPYQLGSLYSSDAKRGLISIGPLTYYATRAREAEVSFRRAMAAPSSQEARLRLGRLYQLIGRRRDARIEIEGARAEAAATGDHVTAYLAALFLGDVDEQMGDRPSAEENYRAAITTFPAGTSARLALGDALVRDGRAEEGWAMVRTALGPDTQMLLRDPWTRFQHFGYGQLGSRLAALRRRVSETPLTVLTAAVARPLIAETKPDQPKTAPAWPVGPVFRSGVEGVRVDVLVTDRDRAVGGLTADDFVVTDNGVRQTVSRSTPAASLSLALVMDTSASLNNDRGRLALSRATDAVRQALTDADRVAVVTGGGRIQLRIGLIPSRADLQSAIAASRPRLLDFTALWDAVLGASSLVVDAPGRPLVFVISDGSDNASWFARDRTIDGLERRGLTVDGIQIPWWDPRGAYDIAHGNINLREPILASGGTVFSVDDRDLAENVANRFAALRQGYVIMYTPENVPAQKDGWHDIKVSLKRGVNGKVRARPGYYAPPRPDR